MKKKVKRKAQVWVETVVYTLIALVMIGAVLAFVKPKIQELQDKTILEQSVGMLQDIDTVVLSIIQGGPGNKRKIELGIKKGTLEIDGAGDKILFKMESRYTYSEPGQVIDEGNLQVSTTKTGKLNSVTLTRNYFEEYDIQYQEKDKSKSINKASTAYSIFISNMGKEKIYGSQTCVVETYTADCTETITDYSLSGCSSDDVELKCEFTADKTRINFEVS